jgi:hypothetical protein
LLPPFWLCGGATLLSEKQFFQAMFSFYKRPQGLVVVVIDRPKGLDEDRQSPLVKIVKAPDDAFKIDPETNVGFCSLPTVMGLQKEGLGEHFFTGSHEQITGDGNQHIAVRMSRYIEH